MPTVSDCILQATRRLDSGPHRERARADAETLLMHVLERNKAWLLTHGDEHLPQAAYDRFADLIERRYCGEPIQHLTGETEFFGLPFRVTRDVLIPRPETEHLVEKVLELAAHFHHPRIVDIGTGSGAIAIALASKLPHAQITATDLSEPALAIARDNAARNGVQPHIRFIQGDLLAPVSGQTFDIVVSNPPYVPHTDRALIAVEVREFEPALALFGGDDGLDVYRSLIPAAHVALTSGGYLALEIGFAQSAAIAQLLSSSAFQHIEFTPDLQGIPRVASAQRV